MERFSIIDHKGIKILVVNHKESTDELFIDTIKQSEALILKLNNPELRLLVDVRDTEIAKNVVEQFKTTALKIKPVCKKTAVLGVSGLKKILLIAVNTFSGIEAKAFAEENEAKDWLVN